jgi:hypothetical protein
MDYKKNCYVDIYRRILKYPPFALKRKPGAMRIVHRVDGGNAEATAATYVTVEDAEKIFAALYFAKNIKNANLNGIEITASQCHISELRRLTNCNDDKFIEHCLQRARSLTLKYIFSNSKGFIVTGILHDARLDAEGVLTILWNKDFFDACKTKALTLNLSVYSNLSPTAKNLYSFLIANNSPYPFSEDLLFERCGIVEGCKNNKQKALMRALKELVDRAIIAGYKVEKKDGKRMYHIQRIREATDA